MTIERETGRGGPGASTAAGAANRRLGIRGLFETHLTVRDLERAVEFYRDRLGLTLAASFPDRRVAFFWLGAPGQGMLGLWQGADILTMRLHFAMSAALADVVAAPARLRAAGITPRAFGGEPTDEPSVLAWMPAAAVYFHDPEGHSLELINMLPDAPRPELGVVPWSAWQGLNRAGTSREGQSPNTWRR